MSSHREAPEIAKDPVADSTDVYAFRHPTKPQKVVLVANFIPLQQPNGGPNFYEFADDVRYEINISNTDENIADIIYRFKFKTKVREESFLYNTGPIDSVKSKTWNRPQTFTVSRVAGGKEKVLATDLACPPVNVGVRSTPNYADLADEATHTVGSRKFFCGQRADAFHVDLGSIFDLAGLRPFNNLHLYPQAAAPGVNAVQSYNVHTIAIEVDRKDLIKNRQSPSDDYKDRRNVIGVWSSASRRLGRIYDSKQGRYVGKGPHVQVSRLGNPLFNEVLVPMGEKDRWNSSEPHKDNQFAKYARHPELGVKIPVLYPTVFPMLKAFTKPRTDLDAILLTGIPDGVIDGFQNYTGSTGVRADMLRLNMAIPPSATENKMGILGGDLAGFPNGRRLGDDVVAIEIQAIAGATISLTYPDYIADPASALVNDGTTNTNAPFLDDFPFLGLPGGGYETVPGTTSAS